MPPSPRFILYFSRTANSHVPQLRGAGGGGNIPIPKHRLHAARDKSQNGELPVVTRGRALYPLFLFALASSRGAFDSAPRFPVLRPPPPRRISGALVLALALARGPQTTAGFTIETPLDRGKWRDVERQEPENGGEGKERG